MPQFGPMRRDDLVYFLRKLGFEPPERGGSHQYMRRGRFKLRIPNDHGSPFSTNLVGRILEQAGITREEWEALE